MKFVLPSLFYFLIGLLFIQCQKDTKKDLDPMLVPNSIQYAKGLEIYKQKGYSLVKITNPWPQAKASFSYILKDKNAIIPAHLKSLPVITVPIQSIVVTSTTHIPALEMLGVENTLVGFPNPDYISSEKTRKRIESGKVREVGKNENLNTEVLIDLAPDVIVSFSLSNSNPTLDNLQKSGLTVMFNGDWTEQSPLGKAEWIKLFGYLTGKEKQASEYFSNVEKEYKRLQQVAKSSKSKPTLFSGNMVGDTWISPAGESFNAVLFADANCKYVYSNTKGTGSLTTSFEKIFKDNRSTEFWFNPGAGSKKELLNARPTLSNFEAVLNNKVYGYTGNEFWERSAIEPHHVLSDLIDILHPEISSKGNNYFYKQLK